MMIQMEDVVDVLFVVYGRRFDIVLLLDHSCKNCICPDALNVHAMNVGFGGKQSSIMHQSQIKECSGYLGSYFYKEMTNQQLNVGNVQTFVFSEEDEGPFYLNKEEREKQRHDKLLGKKPKPKTKTKQELRKEMIDKDPTCNIKGNTEKLQEREKLMVITLEKLNQMFWKVGLVRPKA